MALTELQLPDKTDFYRTLQNLATEVNNLTHKWADVAEFIGNVTSTDLDSMGVAAGQVRTDLANFRTVLNELVAYFGNQSVTPANDPEAVIDKIRRM